MCSVKSNLKWFWILYWNGCGDNQNVCIFAVLWYKQVLMNFWSKYKTLQYIVLLTHFATWIWRLNKPVSKWVKLFNMCCIQKKGVQFTECFRLCNGRNVFWNAYLSTQNICFNIIVMSHECHDVSNNRQVIVWVTAWLISLLHEISPHCRSFARGIHRWPVVSPHKGPITR